MSNYLAQLTLRLAAGMEHIPEERRHAHARFILSQQRADGGFSGREGEGDLYYTGFALRSLAVLGELHGEIADRAAAFLQSRLGGHAAVIDLISLVFGAVLLETAAGINVFRDIVADWRGAISGELEKLRREDGGYAKAAEGRMSSTYQTFLVLLCLELIERPPAESNKIIDFLQSQRAEEGGFLEIRVAKRAGVNPTAAAIGALRILDALDEETSEETIDFLAYMQADEGGLRANTRIPFADLLSTFTGLVTLADLEALEEIDLAAAGRYAHSLEQPTGGFHGVAPEVAAIAGAESAETSDVEYTFYGLCVMSLVTSPRDS